METILTKTNRKIGYTLRFCRRAKGLSQMDLAHNAGLSFRNYQRLENGETLPRMDTLLRLAKELELHPSTLIHCFDKEAIGISEITPSEQEWLQFLKKENPKSKDSPDFAKIKSLLPKSDWHPFHMNGNKFQMDSSTQKHFGFHFPIVNLDHYLIGIKCVDIWEYISRKHLKTVKMVHLLKLPSGLHFIESFHHVHSWNPDHPKSIGCIRDCTALHNLSKWILDHEHRFFETETAT